jgi:hypothetical protein
MFCVPGLIFDGTERVRSCFHVLRSRTCFLQYRGRQVSFSCFARPDSFSALPRASSTVFMFCVPSLVFGGTEGVGSRFHVLCAGLIFGETEVVRFSFHVLRSRTRFRRYRERRVPFSCFALSDSFSAVPRVSNPVFMFCNPGLVFIGTAGIGSHFHVLRSRTGFRRYRGR